eukprot:632815-Rhodomonas_salina.1
MPACWKILSNLWARTGGQTARISKAVCRYDLFPNTRNALQSDFLRSSLAAGSAGASFLSHGARLYIQSDPR